MWVTLPAAARSWEMKVEEEGWRWVSIEVISGRMAFMSGRSRSK
jgi:hypothetical protein